MQAEQSMYMCIRNLIGKKILMSVIFINIEKLFIPDRRLH